MGEPRFIKTKEVAKAITKLRANLEEMVDDFTELASEELKQLGILLVYLFMDLEDSYDIEKDYFPKIKDGLAKEVAKVSLRIAREIAEEP